MSAKHTTHRSTESTHFIFDFAFACDGFARLWGIYRDTKKARKNDLNRNIKNWQYLLSFLNFDNLITILLIGSIKRSIVHFIVFFFLVLPCLFIIKEYILLSDTKHTWQSSMARSSHPPFFCLRQFSFNHSSCIRTTPLRHFTASSE